MNSFIIRILLVVSGVTLSVSSMAQPRIIGGDQTFLPEHQFTVGLLKSSEQNNFKALFCGGTLVADDWLVTAAHCLVDKAGDSYTAKEPSRIDVLAGCNDVESASCQRIGAKKILIHSSYDPENFDNDIALIQLEDLVVAPVLASLAGSRPANGTKMKVLGWGLLQAGTNSFPSVLNEVTVPVVSDSICGNNTSITSNMLCAGYAAGGKDSCQGDSGGPLVEKVAGSYVLGGVVSFGSGCAEPNQYGVYAKVANYKAKIESTISSGSSADFIADIKIISQVSSGGSGGSGGGSLSWSFLGLLGLLLGVVLRLKREDN